MLIITMGIANDDKTSIIAMNDDLAGLSSIIATASQFIVNYGFQFIGALIILVLGWQVARWIGAGTLNLCKRAALDVTLAAFFANVAKTLVLAFVIIIALGKFGITIAPFIAAIGAIAFGGTLALQGPLSNYGSGLVIILTRPFVVGDTITLQGITGIVEEIKLAYTLLSNEDGQTITIPNKQIVGEVICNSYASMLVETVIHISYGDDPEHAIDIIRKVLADNPDVTSQPPPLIGIARFAESAIDIGLRYWVPTRRYYEIQYTVNKEIFRRIREQGIVMAYPQLHVRMQDNSP